MGIKAFPSKINPALVIGKEIVDDYKGMDLRDYFAAKAMQSFLMNVTSIPDSQINEFIEKLPKSCYAIADKMLKERNK